MSSNPPDTISMEEIAALERQILENKAAEDRGAPPPHTIPVERLRAAIATIQRASGISVTAAAGAKKPRAASIELDLGDLVG